MTATNWSLRLRLVAALLVLVAFAQVLLSPLWAVGYLLDVALPTLAGVVGVATLVVLAWEYRLARRATVGRLDPPPSERERDPALHRAVERVVERTGADRPKLSVANSEIPNAVVTGGPADPTLVVTAGLLDALEEDELAAVVAHELVHARGLDRHLMLLAAAPAVVAHLAMAAQEGVLDHEVEEVRRWGPLGGDNILSVLLTMAVTLLFGLASTAVFSVVSVAVARERDADRRAAAVTSPEALASALESVEKRLESLPESTLNAADNGLKTLAFVPQGFDHEPWSAGDEPMDWTDRRAVERRLSDRQQRGGTGGPDPVPLPVAPHPPIDERIASLQGA